MSIDSRIAIGFGYATVDRDGVDVLDADRAYRDRRTRRLFCDRQGFVTLRKVDRYIERRRLWRNKWAVDIGGPLWSAKWKRVGKERWVCVEAGEGFA